MAELNFKFWGNWGRSIEWMDTDEHKAAFLLKVMRYGCFDEVPDIEPWEGQSWELIKTAIDADLKASSNGGAGGRPRASKNTKKTPAKTTAKTPQKTPCETPSETHRETPPETSPETPDDDPLNHKNKNKGESEGEYNPPMPPLDECDGEAAEFAVEALDVFNAETGQDVRDLSPEAWAGLRRVHDAGRTIEDVRRVVKAKAAQWGDDPKMARYVRPSTLFGAKFDEYLNEPEKGGDEVDWSKYA